MSINAIINEFYDKAAERICNNMCYNCKQSCQNRLRFTVSIMGEYDTGIIRKLFFNMLNELSVEITGRTAEKEQSYEEYFKGVQAITILNEISTIKRSATKITRSCNGSDYSQRTMKDIIRKGIRERISRQRIAELFYYKENHRFYDESAEQAYTEIIAGATRGGNSLLSKSEYAKVKKLTEEIMTSVANEVYRSIYDKPAVKDKYKPSAEKFNQGLGEGTPFILQCTIQKKTENTILWYHSTKYWEIAVHQVRTKKYITWKECFKSYLSDNDIDISENSDGAISINTYLDYAKIHLPQLGGISKSIGNYLTRENYNGAYVAEDIGYMLNLSVFHLMNLFKARGKNRNYKSRFELVNSLDDIKALGDVIDMYMTVIAARVSSEEYECLVSSIGNEYKEIKIISDAAFAAI